MMSDGAGVIIHREFCEFHSADRGRWECGDWKPCRVVFSLYFIIPTFAICRLPNYPGCLVHEFHKSSNSSRMSQIRMGQYPYVAMKPSG